MFDDQNDFPQFPHCDPRVLHAPHECEFCDLHPEWQKLRIAWGINFTGHYDKIDREFHTGAPKLPCPSEADRPIDLINQWDGNVPFKDGKINTTAPMFRNKAVVHDAESRHVYTQPITGGPAHKKSPARCNCGAGPEPLYKHEQDCTLFNPPRLEQETEDDLKQRFKEHLREAIHLLDLMDKLDD